MTERANLRRQLGANSSEQASGWTIQAFDFLNREINSSRSKQFGRKTRIHWTGAGVAFGCHNPHHVYMSTTINNCHQPH
ncbi:hypothetical protein HD806DRAFT_497602 [Xylariaceae sp. AK1471]|nr:hypothetical protein HD806DRAFT_497602 [Xylariaceae sp. AK1471]